MDPTAHVRFTRLYEAYYPDVLAYCARRVNRTDAEDVANEVFTVLWRKLDDVEQESAIAWLYGVAHRTITNRWRSNSRRIRLRERLDGLGTETSEPIDTVVVRRDEDRKVFDAMAKLKPADQEVLRLSAWEELGAPQIAEVVGCSVSAAEQRLHRAKNRLAKVLSPSLEPSVAIHPLPAEEGGRP
ncbi:MAG: sigma-70 family RNA polymerase sigma factor [Actinomycetia bacterium]|nr:sigma-70 family RNA polymerase sigma factor [Actinomycetes bacterium]